MRSPKYLLKKNLFQEKTSRQLFGAGSELGWLPGFLGSASQQGAFGETGLFPQAWHGRGMGDVRFQQVALDSGLLLRGLLSGGLLSGLCQVFCLLPLALWTVSAQPLFWALRVLPSSLDLGSGGGCHHLYPLPEFLFKLQESDCEM